MSAKEENKKKTQTRAHLSDMDSIVSLCKRRGFVYRGSEVYGGLAGTWDYGHLGVLLKESIKQEWLRRFLYNRNDMYAVDTSVIMSPRVWGATGHTTGFTDPLVECGVCKKRFRADKLDGGGKCPECGGDLGGERKFNMMFETCVGAEEGEASRSYLRPETAQGMFVNFKNIVDSYHPKLPFGLVQVGRVFRNEIAPRDFLFRAREFEQMEIEYFVRPKQWKEAFEKLRMQTHEFFADIGLPKGSVHEHEIPDSERAFYSTRTIDFEYDYPFGREELCGLAYRADYDLSAHAKESGIDFSYLDDETKERFVPHCVEPSFGLDRAVLAVLSRAYTEEEMDGGDGKRSLLRLPPRIAPILVAVSPLLSNKPKLVEKAEIVFQELKREFGRVVYDDNGNIGKRYRRQDEIGTPYCVTIDFDTIDKDDAVTVRDRDSMKQVRVEAKKLSAYLKDRFTA